MAEPLHETICGHCGKTFRVDKHVLKSRLLRAKNGKVFCGRDCATAFTAAIRLEHAIQKSKTGL